jgi:hypothetical protein
MGSYCVRTTCFVSTVQDSVSEEQVCGSTRVVYRWKLQRATLAQKTALTWYSKNVV